MAILKLKPACKEYVWGGRRLIDEFHAEFQGERLAEVWELSSHEDGPSVIANGPYAGKTLKQYLAEKGSQILGTNCQGEKDFPILTKLIDAREDLSVQVHPDDAFAREHEGQKGKTEMWYVVDCEEGAYLYCGFSRSVSRKELKEHIENQTLTEILNKVYVKRGDVLLVEAGVVHAIGKGILIAEIQENSNVTYRLYDYGRVGADGRARKLHVRRSLEVANLKASSNGKSFAPHLVSCNYFTVDRLFLDGCYTKVLEGTVGEESFVHLMILEGDGRICTGDETEWLQKGDSIFLTARSGDFRIEGGLEALLIRI